MADRRGNGTALQPEAGDEGPADVSILAVTLDHRDLGEIGLRIREALSARRRNVSGQAVGDHAAGRDPDDRELAASAGDPEVAGSDRPAFHAVEADRGHRFAGREQVVADDAAGGDHPLHRAGGKIPDEDDVGAPAGRDHAAIAKAKGIGRRPARHAIDMVQRTAEADQRPDHVVEMAFLGDIERIAVVGAQAHEARRVGVEELGERVQVLGDRALADEDGETLLQLLAPVRGDRGLVVGADAGGKIAVQVVAADERGVAVDMPVLEGDQLVEHVRIGGQHAGEIHELGEADHLRVRPHRQEIGGAQRRPRGFERRRRHTGRELDAQVHHGLLGRIEEIADARDAKHVGDLVRIADRRGDALGQHAAIELGRRDQRGFDVQMRVDKAGHREEAAAIDLATPGIGLVGADDAVARDGDIGGGDAAIDDVEQPDVLDDQVGGLGAVSLRNRTGKGGFVVHRVFHMAGQFGQ